jgi:hypothetical protein
MSVTIESDWSVFDGAPESTCTCRCVYAALKDGDEIPTFRSHAKYVGALGALRSRKPCPACGRTDNLRSVSSDLEPG